MEILRRFVLEIQAPPVDAVSIIAGALWGDPVGEVPAVAAALIPIAAALVAAIGEQLVAVSDTGLLRQGEAARVSPHCDRLESS
jgi:hypothetical protein